MFDESVVKRMEIHDESIKIQAPKLYKLLSDVE